MTIAHPSASLDFVNTSQLDPRVTAARNSSAWRVNQLGQVEKEISNQPRFDYDIVSGKSMGLLIEESRTQLLLQSENGQYNTPIFSNGIQLLKVGEGSIGAARYYDIRVVGKATATWASFNLGYNDTQMNGVTGSLCGSLYAQIIASPGNLPSYRELTLKDYAAGWTSALTATSTGLSSATTSTPMARYVAVLSARADRAVFTLDFNIGTVSGTTYDFTVRMMLPQVEQGSFPTSYIPTMPTFTGRSSSATYVDIDGYVKTAAAAAVRTAYSPGYLGGSGCLLLESAASNLLTRTENMIGITCQASSVTWSDVVSPGNTLAQRITEDTSVAANHKVVYSPVVSAGQTYTLSMFAKARTRTKVFANLSAWNASWGGTGAAAGVFDLSAGTFTNNVTAFTNVSGGMISMLNGWYRCFVTFTIPAGTDITNVQAEFGLANASGSTGYTGDGVSYANFWGMQLEAGNMSSYMPSVVTFTGRASGASGMGSNGLIQYASSGVVRTEYYLGPNLVLNSGPNFSATTNWQVVQASQVSLTVANGELNLVTAGANDRFEQVINCRQYATYLVTATIRASGISGRINIAADAANGYYSLGGTTYTGVVNDPSPKFVRFSFNSAKCNQFIVQNSANVAGAGNITLTNIEVREIIPKVNFFEGAATNLLAGSDAIGITPWSFNSARALLWAAQAPDGSMSATQLIADSIALNTGYVSNNVTGAFGTFTASVYAKAGTGKLTMQPNSTIDSTPSGVIAKFNLNTGSVIGPVGTYGSYSNALQAIVDVGGGWYRCSVTYTVTGTAFSGGENLWIYPFANDDALPANAYVWGAQKETGSVATSYISTPLVFSARASTGTYFDLNGRMQVAASGAVRNSYNPALTYALAKPLLEGATTNLLPNSDDFAGNSGWSGTAWNFAISPYATSIAGMHFTSIRRNTIATSAYMGSTPVAGTAGQWYSCSIYAKALTTDGFYGISICGNYPRRVDAVFNLNNGTIAYSGQNTWTNATASIIPVGNGVYRLCLSGICSTTENINMLHGTTSSAAANSSWEGATATYSDALISCAQLENSPTATSYIGTTGAFTGRTSTGTYVDSAGLIRVAAAGVARSTYNAADLGATPKPMWESQATNLFANGDVVGSLSAVPTGMGYANLPYVVNTPTLGGDTNGLSCKHVRSLGQQASDDNCGYFGFPANPSSWYTISVYCYVPSTNTPDNPRFVVENANATLIGSAPIDKTKTNQWQRVVFSVSTGAGYTAGNPLLIIYRSGAMDGTILYTDGWQAEVGAGATSLIPTTSGTVTRNADGVTYTNGSRAADSYSSPTATRAAETWSESLMTRATDNYTVSTVTRANDFYTVFNSKIMGSLGGIVTVDCESAGVTNGNAGVVAAGANTDEFITIRNTTGQVGTWDGAQELNATNSNEDQAKSAKFASAFGMVERVVANRGLTAYSGSLFTRTISAASATFSLGYIFTSTKMNGHVRSLRFFPETGQRSEVAKLSVSP